MSENAGLSEYSNEVVNLSGLQGLQFNSWVIKQSRGVNLSTVNKSAGFVSMQTSDINVTGDPEPFHH